MARVAAIVVVLTMLQIVSTDEGRAGNKSEPDVSPHLQRPFDIPLERLDRPQRLTGPLNVNRASPHQLKTLLGLNEAEAESISRGRPYKHKEELVTKEILSQSAYDKIKDLITAE